MLENSKSAIREGYAIGYAHETLILIDEVFMEYIERLEKAERLSFLGHGRGLALRVKMAIKQLDEVINEI